MSANIPGLDSEEEIKAILESDSAKIINDYLALQEESETPRDYLIWSLIGFAAGLLGRNVSLRFGPNLTVSPNLFVILLGPSRMRKSSAISMTAALVKGTSLNFAPTDTGAQRHGIMRAMTGLNRIGATKSHYPDLGPLTHEMLHPRRPDDLMIQAPELGRLLGQGSIDMMNFMNDLYDGVEIDYQTKAGETRLTNPLATLLGATTPQNLAGILPDSATGHGILGRIIFVYANKIHKQVPLPPESTDEWDDRKASIVDRLHWIDQNRLHFSISDAAKAEYRRLYSYVAETQDPRLESYRAGRTTLLLKVAMNLCALRNEITVSDSDVLLAHFLLKSAEPNMHKSLEYFGRNKSYVGRMLILEYLRNKPDGFISRGEAIAAAMSELNHREAEEALNTMLAGNELTVVGDKIVLPESLNNLRTGTRNTDKFKR